MRHGLEPTGSPEEDAFTPPWPSLILKTRAKPGLRGERQDRYKQEKKKKKNAVWTRGKNKTKRNQREASCLFSSSSCNATRLFISVTRTVIGADWVTSHWGEMELKICPDGQNKGFGLRSGKQREGGRQEKGKGRCGGGGGGGGGMKRAEKLNKTRGEKERRDQHGGGGRGRKLTETDWKAKEQKKKSKGGLEKCRA